MLQHCQHQSVIEYQKHCKVLQVWGITKEDLLQKNNSMKLKWVNQALGKPISSRNASKYK